jgi:Rieske Fe-S protein
MSPDQDRRSFLRWATHGLSLLFAGVLGFPAICYLIDPRNRKSAEADFRLVDGIRLNEIGDAPVQGVIRAVRTDGWTLHPNDVLGRVWVVKDAAAQGGFHVFTTICPHLGCSVNTEGSAFRCPCHNARFAADGSRLHPEQNPALRGLDALDWERDEHDPNVIRVKYQNFQAGVAQKKPT